MQQESKIEDLEMKLDDALTRVFDRIEKIEKKHDSTSCLLRHVWQLCNRQQELIQKQGSQISTLLKRLNK